MYSKSDLENLKETVKGMTEELKNNPKFKIKYTSSECKRIIGIINYNISTLCDVYEEYIK